MAYPGSRKVEGYLRLPDGPNIAKAENLVKWLKANPGWVYKHRDWVNRSGAMLGKRKVKDIASLAGYVQSKDGTLQQYEGGSTNARGKLVKVWFNKNSPNASAKGAKALSNNPNKTQVFIAGQKVDPKTGYTKGTKPKPTKTSGKTGPTGPVGTTGKGGGAGGGTGGSGDTAAAGSNNSGLFDALASLDPNTGNPTTRGMVDAIVNGQFNPQMDAYRREIGKNPAQLETNLASIKKWYGDVVTSVDKAKTRGADMTKAVADASVGNAKSILGSIGGEAALGAQGVAQSGANAAGTIQALGANDQTYLNDIQPLLQGEAANASTRETARMGDLLQGYKQKLGDLAVEKGGARGKGLVEALQGNNALGQQAFTNRVGLIQTAGALAMDNAKAQNYLAEQQAASEKASGTDNKTIMARIAKANAYDAQSGMLDPADLLARYPRGSMAPGELVQQILATYRSQGVQMTDPRARQAAAGLIGSYGYKVDPKWLGGWR